MLAVLPVLVDRLWFQEACVLGMVLCISFWITVLFFRWEEVLFPRLLIPWALLVWFIALGQGAWYVWGFKPYWVAVLTLLTYEEVVKGRLAGNEFFKTYFWEGLYTGTLIAFLGAFREVSSGYHWALQGFAHPAGIFLLLTCAILIWQSQTPAGEP